MAKNLSSVLGTNSSSSSAGTTTQTGTGNLVLSNNPVLVAPTLGTPASGNLVNCTGYPAANISGTVPSSMTLISTQTTGYEWTGLTTFNRYMLTIDSLQITSTDTSLYYYAGTSSAYLSANYTYQSVRGTSGAATGNSNNSTALGYLINFGGQASKFFGTTLIYGMNTSTLVTMTTATSLDFTVALTSSTVISGGTNITKFKLSSAGFVSGTVSLYGLS